MQVQKLNQFRLPAGFRGRPGWLVQLWWIIQAVLVNTTPQFMYGWRRFVFRSFGAKIGKSVMIRSSVQMQFPWKVVVGDYSWLGDGVVLYSLGNIEIGKHVVISQNCYVCAGSHDYTRPDFPINKNPIVIEDQCWLAADVFVGPGVTIGLGTVVKSRSSVLKDLSGGKIYGGVPAIFVGNRDGAVKSTSTSSESLP
ncbi:colanic acid biosynthesis acetyltransferase WcaF [Segetibacter sp. 3557_3]|uniref:WcaF family extracellular polysaccharide biosynthesis acetyltransferase n=1 Tax=Segetibacter sp. 3557_3 TaxID=2547429 RepID=UPI00105871F9|nr:WcaF family extracellular polysaccharide biosynthesis acetyltransferase [Segetibacter sp. 3557_3]TDH20825.1 colanic acid biosynthesis acetyltransferase WcaF [Segetibacter sp. 3557_3]